MTEQTSTASSWSRTAAEVEAHLEGMRVREVQRYARKLRSVTEEQEALVHVLTRAVLQRAVLDVLEQAAPDGTELRPEEIEAIRKMFAGNGVAT